MKNSWAFLKRIWPYLSPYKLRVALVVLFSFFTSGLNLLPIQVMATFVDVVSSSPTKKTSTFWVRYLGTNPINYILAFALIVCCGHYQLFREILASRSDDHRPWPGVYCRNCLQAPPARYTWT